jgi:hypothetical protein
MASFSSCPALKAGTFWVLGKLTIPNLVRCYYRYLPVAALSLVINIDFLLAYVLLYHFLFLDNLLTQANLLAPGLRL